MSWQMTQIHSPAQVIDSGEASSFESARGDKKLDVSIDPNNLTPLFMETLPFRTTRQVPVLFPPQC
jgi:hypothetical protein